MLHIWCQGMRLQRWIMSCCRGVYMLEGVLACTVNSDTIQGVRLPRLRTGWEHSDEFCCTRWKEDQASIHWEGHTSAVSERRIRSFLNRGDCWYPGQKEQGVKLCGLLRVTTGEQEQWYKSVRAESLRLSWGRPWWSLSVTWKGWSLPYWVLAGEQKVPST